LDGADGREIWRDNLLARIGVTQEQDSKAIAWGRSASPLIVDNLVVVPLGGPVDGPKDSLAAFDTETGSLVWKGGRHQASYSSPVLATLQGERQILIVNQDYVSGHRVETGEQLWEFPWPGCSATNANVSQVVPLSESRVLVSKGYHGGAKLVEISVTGDTWQTSDVWVNDRVLLTKFSNVVVRDDYVLGLSDGILQCVDIASGKRLWRAGRYNQGQILGVRGPEQTEDLLLVQAESGDVILVWTRREGSEELGRIAALDGRTWNNPALYGRFLLVRNDQTAACYELPVLP
jgi:outer membrane protein assembly factor BamB